MLRVDTTMHTARIRKLIHDAPRDRLLTASDDKTVRLWQLPQGRLLRVFRVPIAEGFEGRVYVADMHPDGRLVAAGGWTGWDFEGASSVYLFDVETGAMVRRLSGFAETIGTLGFSPDGRHLAVGLLGAKGLRILRTSDWVEVGRDAEYGDRVLDLSFAADGRLAVASLDGYLRLYSPGDGGFRLVGRRKTSTGAQPLSIKFSPDGRSLAVGFNDLAAPALYRAGDLSLERSVDAAAIRDQRRLQNIQWSDDGESLYATGEQAEGSAAARIYRWRARGHGGAETIEVDAQRPGSLWPLRGGRMAFAAEDPWIGVLEADGRVRVAVPPDVVDPRTLGTLLRVSDDASTVEIAADTRAQGRVELDITRREVRRLAAGAPGLPAPRVAATRWRFEAGAPGGRPSLNGTPLALDDYEFVRASMATADGERFVLGTEWSVRAYDAEGRARWRYRASGVVRQLAGSADGRRLVVAVSDGTLRWLRAEDGIEYLAAYVHPRTLEWIVWTPSGHYLSSPRGDDSIGWHLNRSADEAPLFYRAAQFERLLYRPDIVDAALVAREPRPAVTPSRRVRDFDVAELRRIAPPTVRVALRPGGAAPARARLHIEAESAGLPMRDLTVFVNNVPVTPWPARTLGNEDARRLSRELELEFDAAENAVRVEIGNGEALGVGETLVDAAPSPRTRGAPPDGDLYVLAIGINRFPALRPNGEAIDLDFAVRDAQELAGFFRTAGPRQFRKVHVELLSDARASRAEILRALGTFSRAGPRDTVIVFLASHGVSDSRGNYFFVPADATTRDWLGAISGLDETPTMIHWSVFFDALRRASGRRLLVVDTCHARGIEGNDLHSLAKRSASSRFSMLVAAKANEESQEYAPGRHGLFTYALLDALRGAGDADRDGWVTLQEAFGHVQPLVERHRYPGKPQTPQLHAPAPLERTVLVRTAR